jgi:hypothetical protein
LSHKRIFRTELAARKVTGLSDRTQVYHSDMDQTNYSSLTKAIIITYSLSMMNPCQ